MTATDPTRPSSPHVLVAAAEGDERLALRLWRALIERGLRASINDAHVFSGEASALMAIVSEDTADSLAFSEQVMAFRGAGAQQLFFAGRNTDLALPPVMMAERGAKGLLQAAEPPEALGQIEDDDRSVAALADTLGDRLGVPRPHRPLSAPTLRRMAGGLAAALVLSVSFAGWSHVRSETALAEAERAGALGQELLTVLAAEFPTNPSGAAVLALASQLETTFDAVPLEALSDAAITQHARLFHAIGEARDLHGEPEGAQRAFMRAHAATGAMLARASGDPERIFAHSQSAFWAGNSAFRAGDLQQAAEYMRSYSELTHRLVEIDSSSALYAAELGHAANNRGVIAMRADRTGDAIALFEQAIESFEGAPLSEGYVSPRDIANTRGWRADALFHSGELARAAEERAREAATYREALEDAPQDTQLRWELANAEYRGAVALAQLGQTGVAAEWLEPSVVEAARLVREHPDNIRYARLYVNSIRERARLAHWRGEATRAQLLIGEARSYIARADEAGQNDARHIDRGLIHLLGAEIALDAGAIEDAYREATEAILAGEQAQTRGFETAHELLAQAYFLHGEALRSEGDDAAAVRSFRSAATHAESAPGFDASLALQDMRARALWRQGETTEALTIRSRLEDAEYSRADYTAFWQVADGALGADNSSITQQGDDRG